MAKVKGKAKANSRKKKLTQQQGKFLSYQKRLISNIRTFDDPILKEKCSDVESLEEVEEITNVLKKVIFATSTGVGLAAPQVGFTKNIVIIKPNLRSKEVFFLVNPEIIEHSKETEVGTEGCLSYPGVFAEVERYTWIKVKYLDTELNPHIIKYKDKEGVIVAHEIDHLQGICIVGDAWAKQK
jgi:peptide deformylase